MNTEETAAMWLQAKERPGLSATARSQGEARKVPPLEPPGEAWPW